MSCAGTRELPMDAGLQILPLVQGEGRTEALHEFFARMAMGAHSRDLISLRDADETGRRVHGFLHVVGGVVASVTARTRNSLCEVDIMPEEPGDHTSEGFMA
jgi:hypothetical protein